MAVKSAFWARHTTTTAHSGNRTRQQNFHVRKANYHRFSFRFNGRNLTEKLRLYQLLPNEVNLNWVRDCSTMLANAVQGSRELEFFVLSVLCSVVQFFLLYQSSLMLSLDVFLEV